MKLIKNKLSVFTDSIYHFIFYCWIQYHFILLCIRKFLQIRINKTLHKKDLSLIEYKILFLKIFLRHPILCMYIGFTYCIDTGPKPQHFGIKVINDLSHHCCWLWICNTGLITYEKYHNMYENACIGKIFQIPYLDKQILKNFKNNNCLEVYLNEFI